jgi:hypothetical protein
MMLKGLIRAVDELSGEEFETLYRHVREQHQQRAMQGVSLTDQVEDHPSAPLNIAELKQLFAAMREGLSPAELDELEWAMNVEYAPVSLDTLDRG